MEVALLIEGAIGTYGRNANLHLRVTVEVSIPDERLDLFYPKVRQGLRKVWDQENVK